MEDKNKLTIIVGGETGTLHCFQPNEVDTIDIGKEIGIDNIEIVSMVPFENINTLSVYIKYKK